MDQKYVFRLAELNDCERIFEIRNKPEIRLTSLNQDEIEFCNHEKWFKATLKNPLSHLFVIDISKIIGVIRFDINGPEATISVYIDPHYHQQGFGSLIYREGEKWLENNYMFIEEIIAEILPRNLSSKIFFAKMGFVEKEKSVWRKKIYPRDTGGTFAAK